MSQNPKRQKRETPRMSCLDAIGASLTNAKELIVRDFGDNVSKIEIEARLGMVVCEYRRWKSTEKQRLASLVDDESRSMNQLIFKSGIDPIFAKSLKTRLGERYKSEVLPLQVIRCSNDSTRWEIDSAGQVTMSEQKTSVAKHDIALLAHHYDLRINVANENDISGRNKNVSDRVTYDRWTQERRKRRTSFHHRTWKLDFTEVDIVDRSGGRSHEIEFELELQADVTRNWLLLKDPQQSHAETSRIATELLGLIDQLVPFDEDTGKELPLTVSPNAPDLERQIQTLHQKLFSRRWEFLGSMPVNLSRQNLNNVNSLRYHITEKSDGVRYLLYVLKENGRDVAFLVNRSKKIYRFPSCELLGSWLRPGSILDGELVYNKKFNEEVFMVFDVLCWEGHSLIDTTFTTRRDLIQSTVIATYANGYSASASANAPGCATSLKLIRKIFYEKGQFADLLRKISFEGGERCFNDGDRRHHKSDGIIFQPDGSYVFSKHYDLMKWKWPELRSIDLQVTVEPDGTTGTPVVYLKCGGGDGSLINCTQRGSENIGLGVYDTLRLLADMEGAGLGSVQGSVWRGAPAIAEVAYDVNVGMWEYMQLRRDKNEPNFITSVMGVFTEQAESICIEELKFIMTAATYGLENDYDMRLQRKKEELLREQESQLRNHSG